MSKFKIDQEYREKYGVGENNIKFISEIELLAKLHRKYLRQNERKMAVKI